MLQPRIIKKYPNRRLYDTAKSKYITITDVKELVMAGVEIKVFDNKSEEDLTRSVLLQIIMEEESRERPMFSENTLAHLIRFYGGTAQGVFGQYLEESLAAFNKQQHLFTANTQNPLENMTQIAQKNMEMWSDLQNSFFNGDQNKPKD